MSLLYTCYNLLTSALFIVSFPPLFICSALTGRYRNALGQRLGFYPKKAIKSLSGRPRIWLHAVSVGEVKAAIPILEALKKNLPFVSLILSAGTPHGLAVAAKLAPDRTLVVFAPVDFIGSILIALRSLKPDVLALMETELWPCWLVEAKRFGIKTALINARVSSRSLPHYLMFRRFAKEVLAGVDTVSAISLKDAHRMQAIGASHEKIKINGNSKYDSLARQSNPGIELGIRGILNISLNHPVFVAGSTRTGEERAVLQAFKKMREEFCDMLLVVAPRHIERTAEVLRLIEQAGFSCVIRSKIDPIKRPRVEDVVLIDTVGELFNFYSAGTIVFCGGSLVPRGGQNILEVVAWGRPVFYGQFMEDFLDEKEVIEQAGAGVMVKDSTDLAEKALWFLRHPEELQLRGEQGREALFAHKGAAERHAQAILELL
ncbi:MAG: 3-deoxy-D-manno-octulosonic acid transferase [Pseudomonadota bacterium]